MEGRHHHGFMKRKSTTTALLELQSAIAWGLDNRKITATYSLDMSTAFDLLRPDIFHQMSDIPECLMNPIMDFLTSRKIYVQYGTSRSRMEEMNVGCVQGSVLGPKLFALYCKDLVSQLPKDVHITSYADDSYVTIYEDTIASLQQKVETTLSMHKQYLESIGMVVNKTKTVLIVFDRKNQRTLELRNGIKSKEVIKALGVQISYNLDWSHHVSSMVAKTSHIISKVRFLRRWIDQDSALQIITSQYFGTIYYGVAVWMTPKLQSSQWRRLDSSHYRALRAAIGDYKRKLPKAVLDIIAKRATPKQWSNYVTASTAIKLFNSKETRIGEQLRQQCYINDRQPRKGTFFDTSNLKIGRQSFQNRLQVFTNINFDWIGEITNDAIRINLKKQFFNS